MQIYLVALRDAEGVVNTPIVIAAANGIVRRHNSNLWWTHCPNKALGPVFDGKNGIHKAKGYVLLSLCMMMMMWLANYGEKRKLRKQSTCKGLRVLAKE